MDVNSILRARQLGLAAMAALAVVLVTVVPVDAAPSATPSALLTVELGSGQR